MASHGRRGVSALLLGSETQKVLTHSKLPVLVSTLQQGVEKLQRGAIYFVTRLLAILTYVQVRCGCLALS